MLWVGLSEFWENLKGRYSLRSPMGWHQPGENPSGLGSIDFLRLSLETTPNLPGEDWAWGREEQRAPVTGVTLAIHKVGGENFPVLGPQGLEPLCQIHKELTQS